MAFNIRMGVPEMAEFWNSLGKEKSHIKNWNRMSRIKRSPVPAFWFSVRYAVKWAGPFAPEYNPSKPDSNLQAESNVESEVHLRRAHIVHTWFECI